MKKISNCSAGRFELHISRDGGLNYTQVGVAMTFTTNTSMTNGLDVPQLLRSPSTSNTSVSVGDKVKIVYRALQIDGYSSNDSLRTSCGLDYEHAIVSLESGNALSIDSTITGWHKSSDIVNSTSTMTDLEFIHTVGENDNLNFCGIMSVEEKSLYTNSHSYPNTNSYSDTNSNPKSNSYSCFKSKCILGKRSLMCNGEL